MKAAAEHWSKPSIADLASSARPNSLPLKSKIRRSPTTLSRRYFATALLRCRPIPAGSDCSCLGTPRRLCGFFQPCRQFRLRSPRRFADRGHIRSRPHRTIAVGVGGTRPPSHVKGGWTLIRYAFTQSAFYGFSHASCPPNSVAPCLPLDRRLPAHAVVDLRGRLGLW
jgi:hypothetical protein